MKKISYILAILIVIISCKKESPINSYPIFNNYCPTDNNGNSLNDCDSTDWVLDFNWLPIEKNLFPNYNSLTHIYRDGFSATLYPNPLFAPIMNASVCYLHLSSPLNYNPPEINLSIVVVDSLFNKIFSVTHSISHIDTTALPSSGIIVGEHNILENFDFSNINLSNRMIRVYYIYTKNDTCIYKSHGDIKIGWED